MSQGKTAFPNINDDVVIEAYPHTGKNATVREIYMVREHVMLALKVEGGPVVPYRRDEVRLRRHRTPLTQDILDCVVQDAAAAAIESATMADGTRDAAGHPTFADTSLVCAWTRFTVCRSSSSGPNSFDGVWNVSATSIPSWPC